MKIQRCDVEGCNAIGSWGPVIIVDHDGPSAVQNPLRVAMKCDYGLKTERPLKVCNDHSRMPLSVFASSLDWRFLREVMGSDQVIHNIDRNCNRVGLQFVLYGANGQPAIDENGKEILRVHPEGVQLRVQDRGEVKSA